MRGNVNDSKRVSPYDLGGIAKLSGKPVSLTDSLSHSRRTPKELLERIASLESQLATRDALIERLVLAASNAMAAGNEYTPTAMDHWQGLVNEIEGQEA